MLIPLLLLLIVKPSFALFDISSCGVDKGCLFGPNGCIPGQNCTMSFSYQVEGENLIIELSGTPPQQEGFVAVGFSKDQQMGDDSITFCSYDPVRPGGQNVQAMGYTNGKSLEAITSPTQYPLGYTLENGEINCRVRRQISNTGDAKIFDLNGTYYILMAVGPAKDNMPGYHGATKWIMPKTDLGRYGRDVNGNPITNSSSVDMTAGQPKTTHNKLKIAHGILMLLAWGVFLFTGILFARYFKGHLPNKTFLGVKIWFNFHRTLNTIGLACTIASFVCIFVEKDWRWIGPRAFATREENQSWSSIHAILGLLACVVAWAQPLNAVFRCDPEAKTRIIFNWIHRFFGFGAWLMAAAATMIAMVHFTRMFSNRDAALGLYIAYISVVGLSLIALEALSWRSWFKNRRSVGNEIEMVRVGGSSGVVLSEDTQKTQNMQSVILLSYIVVAVGTTVAICVLIGLRPN